MTATTNIAALVVALLAASSALWLNFDAVQPLHRLLQSWHSPLAQPIAEELPDQLHFDALRDYSAALSADALRWGTYRSGLYHGVRSRTYPYSVSAGLLWGSTHEDVSQLRHECRQEDRLQTYGWRHHDGRLYGWQTIEDQFNRVDLHTHYVRLPDQRGWASRFSAAPLEPKDARLQKKHIDSTNLSLFFYVDLTCGDESPNDGCRRKLHNLMDVAAEPTQGPCDGDASATCAAVSFQSEGVKDGDQEDDIDAPLEFHLLVQLKTRADATRIRHSELRFAGLKDTTVLNVKEQLVSLATRTSPQDADDEITLDNIIEEESTLLVVQAVVEFDASVGRVEHGDVQLDIVFQEGGSPSTTSPRALREVVDHAIPAYRAAFERQFEEMFDLSTNKGYNTSQVAFAQAAFSSLIGGTGFFYGRSLVQHDPNDPSAIQEMPPKPLFTAVPSRSFFPRGFVWDDGFHQLGISTFDEGITRDVLVHWLGVMEEDGYIAREQILGATARRRVPSEFLVQHVEHANPPTLLLTLDKMLAQWKSNGGVDKDAKAYIKLIFPFVERWYSWFVTTQRGPALEDDDIVTLQWRGRRADDGKLIANTLSSGLDDYPRASVPSGMEMHVDLLCWMIKASDVLASLGTTIGLPASLVAKYHTHKARFLTALDAVHWSDHYQAYLDVGEHNAEGHVEQQIVVRCRNEETGQTADTTATYQQLEQQQVQCPPSHPRYLFPLGDGQGGLKMQPVFVADSPTQLQHVHHIGYVSLFPLLLEIVAPDSPRLEVLLNQLSSPEHLWSPFGLRSLSTRDLFYEQENAHGDNPYWRGSIWINANYLALKALHHYGETSGPYQQRARDLYSALRTNVVSTIHGEYERTGYLWEQYSGNIHSEAQYGRGQRCHPFSGWTALVVNIMAEKY